MFSITRSTARSTVGATGRRGPVLRLLLAAGLLLAGPSAVQGPADAADGIPGVVYNSANGHYYKLYQVSGNWTQADSAATAVEGYLVTFTSQAELDWVIQNVGTGSGKVLIGATDQGHEGIWTWVTGETWAWSNWNGAEPNNSGGNENVAEMYNTGKWNDVPGTYIDPGYIVEWNVNPNAPPPPVTPDAPTGLSAALGFDGTIDLDWTDNSTNESEFEVERWSALQDWTRVGRPGINVTTFKDTDLHSSVDYTYRVRARNSVGPSDWSNEATATAGVYIPSPRAPSDFLMTGAARDSVDLQWTDNSDGESGFEIHRRTGAAEFAYLASTAPNATTFHDSGLPPATEYEYAVRSVGTLQTSSFVVTPGATLSTLTVTTLRGDLKDSPKFGKDSLKVTASWETLPASDGSVDPVAEGITFRVGPDEAPLGLKIAAGDFWKGRKTKKKWKSPKGLNPRVAVTVDEAAGTVLLVVKKAEFSAPAGDPVRVSLEIGDDAGTERRTWTVKKPGFLQVR